VPTRRVIAGVTTILPSSSTVTVTVELVPRELIAALSTVTAPVAWPVTIVALADMPGLSAGGVWVR